MKHIEAQPEAIKENNDARQKRRPPSGLRMAAFALIFVGGIGYGMTTWWNPLPTDDVSAKEKAELVTAFTHLRSIAIEPVKDQDVETALDSMRLDPNSRLALTKALGKSTAATGANHNSPATSVLATIVLWDFASPDGDVVQISSGGYQVNVTLQNPRTSIAIPVDAGGSIKLTGVHDGGGGITVGIQHGAGAVSLPVLAVGQVLSLPVTF